MVLASIRGIELASDPVLTADASVTMDTCTVADWELALESAVDYNSVKTSLFAKNNMSIVFYFLKSFPLLFIHLLV